MLLPFGAAKPTPGARSSLLQFVCGVLLVLALIPACRGRKAATRGDAEETVLPEGLRLARTTAPTGDASVMQIFAGTTSLGIRMKGERTIREVMPFHQGKKQPTPNSDEFVIAPLKEAMRTALGDWDPAMNRPAVTLFLDERIEWQFVRRVIVTIFRAKFDKILFAGRRDDGKTGYVPYRFPYKSGVQNPDPCGRSRGLQIDTTAVPKPEGPEEALRPFHFEVIVTRTGIGMSMVSSARIGLSTVLRNACPDGAERCFPPDANGHWSASDLDAMARSAQTLFELQDEPEKNRLLVCERHEVFVQIMDDVLMGEALAVIDALRDRPRSPKETASESGAGVRCEPLFAKEPLPGTPFREPGKGPWTPHYISLRNPDACMFYILSFFH